MRTMHIEFDRGGVHLPALGLWLDPHHVKTGKVFVSHAHADHLAAHREVIVSEATARLMRARLPRQRQEHVLPFGQPMTWDHGGTRVRITLLPAGHILGSAMALVEAGGQRLLHTGDFKLRPGLAAEPCEPVTADILVMETTFGRPRYAFPPALEVFADLIRFCRKALQEEATPVLLAYSLGKSQELLAGLADAGLPLMVHPETHKMTRLYEHLGRRFPPYRKLDLANADGHVLVIPPNADRPKIERAVRKIRTAVVSGWAVDSSCRHRHRADAAFPLSDHADFPELLEMVERVRPAKIMTLHGFAADFAAALRERGHDARALSEPDQLELPLTTAFRPIPAIGGTPPP